MVEHSFCVENNIYAIDSACAKNSKQETGHTILLQNTLSIRIVIHLHRMGLIFFQSTLCIVARPTVDKTWLYITASDLGRFFTRHRDCCSVVLFLLTTCRYIFIY